MDRKFFGVSFLGNLKIHKKLSPSFFKQSSSNFQEMFFILKEKTFTLEFKQCKKIKILSQKLKKSVFFSKKHIYTKKNLIPK